MGDKKAPTLNTVAAMLWDGYRADGVWPSQRSIATRFGVRQDKISGIVAALERKGAVPNQRERMLHNNRVGARKAMKRLRSREAGTSHPDDLMTDAELATLYAGRRYEDMRLTR